jgi:O-antigen/teichoic acid export membrane protein
MGKGWKSIGKYSISAALPAGAQLLLLPIYSWYLSPEALGRLSLVQALILIFQLLSGQIFSAAIGRFWVSQGEGVIRPAYIAVGGLSLLGAIPLLLLMGFSNPMGLISFELMMYAWVIASLSSAESLYQAVCIQQGSATLHLRNTVLHVIGSVAGSLAGLFIISSDPEGVMAGRGIGMACVIIPLSLPYIFKLDFPSKISGLQLWKYVLPLIPYLFLQQLVLASDRWITGILLDEKSVALMSYAVGFLSICEMGYQALRNQYQPDIYNDWQQGESAHRWIKQLIRQGAWGTLLAGPCAAMGVMVLLPPVFHPLISLMPWILAGFLFRLAFISASLPEFFSPRSSFLVLTSLSGWITLVGLSWWGIPYLGLPAMAMAWMFSRVAAVLPLWLFPHPQYKIIAAYRSTSWLLILLIIISIGGIIYLI